MDSQDLEILEDSSVQLCSYSKVMSNSTRTANAQEFREETGNVTNPGTTQTQTQTQTDIAGSNVTQMEPIPNSNSCSSHTLSAETDSRSPKRRRSDSIGSFRSSEAAKRQRYGEGTGAICASPQYMNHEDTLAAEADSGVPRTSPPSNGAASSPIYGREHWPEVSLATEPGMPQTRGWVQDVRPSLPLPNVHPSPTRSLSETVPYRTIGLTIKGASVPLRGQMPEQCTLSPFAPRPGSITNSRNREEISLSPMKDLVEDPDEPGINSVSLQYSSPQPMVREPMFPGLFETRRWGFAKGASNRTAVLVAGDWYPGPALKPFDPVCYDDDALE